MKHIILYVTISTLTLIGCNKSTEQSEYSTSEVSISSPVKDLKNDTTNKFDNSQKIIKSAIINIETDSIKALYQKISNDILKFNGYIEYENQTGTLNNLTQTINCKIPEKRFDEFVNKLSFIQGQITLKEIKRTDITREYKETALKIDSYKALQMRYIELLAKASKVSEMIEIEAKLNEIKSSIQNESNHFNYLNKQLKYSTIEITLISNSISDSPKFTTEIFNALKGGFSILKSIILGLITLWPIWLCVALGIVVFRKYIKK
ncbi:DUF4349 domain-containing protein [Pedobacter glucosidilyticus]|uniref:DUF4349 domain-containing protein n=1 Tax=Pedobacter glucosidilyticus TaxID=1122941 RepID=UPI0026E98D42|nr:DUF4349 domain-containing protein [Pedobacter glucosidilyticus]